MLTSGMTGYVPNKSDSAAAFSWDALFQSIGDPHVNDETNASFDSQISKVFQVRGANGLWIAMADRWLPHIPVDARLADVFTRVIGSTYEPEKYTATKEERREMYRANELENANTSHSQYVWLPIHITPPSETHSMGRNSIIWYDSWKWEDFV